MTAKTMTAEEIEAVRTSSIERMCSFRSVIVSAEEEGLRFAALINRLLATVDALTAENAAMREVLAKIIKTGEYPAPDGMVRIAREALEAKP